MRKFYTAKRIIAASLAAAVMTSALALPAAAEDAADVSETAAGIAATATTAADITAAKTDKALSDAAEFFELTEILTVPASDSLDKTSVSRGKFASLLGEITGGKSVSTTRAVEEDDGWLWLGDRESGAAGAAQTGFSDVPADHKYAAAIKNASENGYMNGDGSGSFRPNDRITATECFAALVRLLNADFAAGSGNFETKYAGEAKRLGLTKNLDIKSYTQTVSARDAYVMLFNALLAEVYTLKSMGDSEEYVQTDGYLLASVYFDIYKARGVFGENQRTSLTADGGCGEGAAVIGGVRYKTESGRWDGLLGYRTEVYYRQTRGGERELVYAAKYKNEEKTVDAEDIDSFEKPVFRYFDKNDKEMTVTVKGDEDIIYNGKAITDWKTDIFKPECGSVTFIDNDSDGVYEVIVIDSAEVVFVSAVDKTNEVFVDKYSNDSYNVHEKEYVIYDSNGAGTGFESLSEKNVLEVRRTLDVQGEPWIEIHMSDAQRVGEVTSTGKDFVLVDGEKIKISRSCTEKYSMGDYGVFYLTSGGRIAGFESAEKDYYTYGWLMNAGRQKDSLDSKYRIKLYSAKDEFVTCEFADKVKVNGSRVKAEEAYSTLTSEGKVVPQLLRFRLNADGALCEFETAGGTEDGFVKSASSVSGQCRTVIKALVGSRYSTYYESDTVVMSVPETDTANERLYSIEKSFTNDANYSFVSAYYPDKDSVVADVLLKNVTEAISSRITTQSTPAMIVAEVGHESVDGDEYTTVSGYENGSYVTKRTDDGDLAAALETLNKGDIIRVQRNTAGKIKAYVKLYDIQTRRFVGYENPVASSNGNLIVEFVLLHGEAWKRASEEKIIRVMPYVYDQKSGTVTEGTDEKKLYSYDGSLFTTILVDTTGRDVTITKVNSRDVVTRDKFGKGDELLLYTVYSTPYTMIIIR